mgnify:CR=1 FL=1
MIEEVIYKHLRDNLDVPVYLEEPENAPTSFVVCERTSNSRKDYLHSTVFAFQSYAETLYEAAKLNEQLKQAVDSLIGLDEVAFARLNNDYNFTDATTKRYRYQAVYEIKY